MDCIFCKIINNEIPSYTLYEDNLVKVFLDVSPNTNGHCLIVPKKHFTNLVDIDLETLNHINKISKEMYKILKEKLNCEGLTLIQNNDYGQEIRHFHIHLVPRYENDLLNHEYNKELLIDIKEVFEQLELEYDDQLIITRKFTLDGKNSIKVNGQTVNVSMLKKITSGLVDVHGQSEHFHLLKTR